MKYNYNNVTLKLISWFRPLKIVYLFEKVVFRSRKRIKIERI